jgi:proline iminopeptidase
VQVECARAWARWEFSAISFWPDASKHADVDSDQFAVSFARVECHYFVNGGFFDADDHVIRNLDKVRHIPTVLIQGRYDMCTPMRTAWDIHKAWPQAEFRLVGDAGHAGSEPGIVHELICATDRFAGID